MLPVPGAVLGGGSLTLERLLGEGGMGTVWRTRRSDGTVVAVKLLHGALDASMEGGEDRLRDEASAAMRVLHPDLVRLHGSGVDPSYGPYLVYECLSGGSLRTRLARDGRIPPPETVATVATPLLQALEALHRGGVVHRDVKPENLLADEGGRFKLGDLGLAVFSGREARTQEGLLVGTPGYVAPERLTNPEAAPTPAGDIYAAAALLVESLTGAPPFAGASPAAAVHEQLRRDIAPHELSARGAPPALASVLARALSRDPARRPGSAALFLDALRSALTAPAPAAAPTTVTPSLPARIERRVQSPPPGASRRRGPALAAAAALVALLVLGLAAGIRPTPPSPAPAPRGAPLERGTPAWHLALVEREAKRGEDASALAASREALAASALLLAAAPHDWSAHTTFVAKLVRALEPLGRGAGARELLEEVFDADDAAITALPAQALRSPGRLEHTLDRLWLRAGRLDPQDARQAWALLDMAPALVTLETGTKRSSDLALWCGTRPDDDGLPPVTALPGADPPTRLAALRTLALAMADQDQTVARTEPGGVDVIHRAMANDLAALAAPLARLRTRSRLLRRQLWLQEVLAAALPDDTWPVLEFNTTSVLALTQQFHPLMRLEEGRVGWEPAFEAERLVLRSRHLLQCLARTSPEQAGIAVVFWLRRLAYEIEGTSIRYTEELLVRLRALLPPSLPLAGESPVERPAALAFMAIAQGDRAGSEAPAREALLAALNRMSYPDRVLLASLFQLRWGLLSDEDRLDEAADEIERARTVVEGNSAEELAPARRALVVYEADLMALRLARQGRTPSQIGAAVDEAMGKALRAVQAFDPGSMDGTRAGRILTGYRHPDKIISLR